MRSGSLTQQGGAKVPGLLSGKRWGKVSKPSKPDVITNQLSSGKLFNKTNVVKQSKAKFSYILFDEKWLLLHLLLFLTFYFGIIIDPHEIMQKDPLCPLPSFPNGNILQNDITTRVLTMIQSFSRIKAQKCNAGSVEVDCLGVHSFKKLPNYFPEWLHRCTFLLAMVVLLFYFIGRSVVLFH